MQKRHDDRIRIEGCEAGFRSCKGRDRVMADIPGCYQLWIIYFCYLSLMHELIRDDDKVSNAVGQAHDHNGYIYDRIGHRGPPLIT